MLCTSCNGTLACTNHDFSDWKSRGMAGACILAALALAYKGTAADVAVDRNDFTAVTNQVDQTQADDLLLESGAGGVIKSGKGKYAFALDKSYAPGGVTVSVASGSVVAFSGKTDVATAIEPNVVVEKAALWLKGDKNLQKTGSDVLAWYDCREAESSGSYGTVYSRMTTESEVKPLSIITNGYSAVSFRGYGTGAWMRYRDASSAESKLEGLFHVFLVYSTQTSKTGFPLGSISGTHNFHVGLTTDPWTYYCRKNTGFAVRSGQSRLDGISFDPYFTPIKTGAHLYEFEAGGAKVLFSTFFNDRGNSGRFGGCELMEVVAFTNRINAVDRIAVSRYLVRKYGLLDDTKTAFVADLQPGSTLEVASGNAQVMSPTNGVRISGVGNLEVRDSRLILSSRNARSFDGTVRFSAQTSYIGGALPYDAKDGDVLTVTAGSGNGENVVTPSSGEPGTFVKEGPGDLRLSDVPEDIKGISVVGGTLTIGGAGVNETPVERAIAIIANPGFETNGGEPYYTCSTVDKEDTTTVPGWSVYIPKKETFSNNGMVWIYDNKRQISRPWFCPYDAPEGRYAIGFLYRGQFWTTVSVPVDGVYELSFKSCGRLNYSAAGLEISLDGTVFAHFCGSTGTGWVPNRYRTPFLTSGEHVLKLATTTEFDSAVSFDDFSMVRVADGVWPVANGDFEHVTYAARKDNNAENNGTLAGWTRTDDGSSCAAYLVPRDCATTTTFFEPMSHGGSHQIQLIGNGPLLTSDSFAIGDMPSGCYYLRCDAADAGADYQWKKFVETTSWQSPVLTAKLSVNGKEMDMGTATVGSCVFRSIVFSKAAEIPSGATLTLTVSNSRADGQWSAVSFDNLEFVSAEEVERDREYIVNGDFETGNYDGWTRETRKDSEVSYLKNCACSVIDTRTETQHNFPYAKPSGEDENYALRMVQCPLVYQDVTFDDAGIYRLKFAANGRNNTKYSGNAVRFWVVKSGSAETNFIYETSAIYTSEFANYSTFFRIDQPGNYRFAFEGLNGLDGRQVGARADDATCQIDRISVRKALPQEVGGLDSRLEITLGAQTKLHLDFDGTQKVSRVRAGGKTLHGTISAVTYPDLVSGIGAIEPERRGLLIVVE